MLNGMPTHQIETDMTKGTSTVQTRWVNENVTY